jgi:hypothetical protein
MGKSPDQVDPGELDNHGKPALVVDRLGYIHVIFGSHGGDPKYGPNPLGEFFMGTKGKMTHVVSAKPGDISAWRIVDNLPANGTYSQWVKLANGDLYLSTATAATGATGCIKNPRTTRRTFAAPVSVLKHKESSASPLVDDAWYAWFDNGKGDTITASFVYHPAPTRGTPTCASTRTTCRWIAGTARGRTCRAKRWRCRPRRSRRTGSRSSSPPAPRNPATAAATLMRTGIRIFFRFAGAVRYCRWDGRAWQKPVSFTADYGKGSDGDFIVDSATTVRALLTQSKGSTGRSTGGRPATAASRGKRSDGLLRARPQLCRDGAGAECASRRVDADRFKGGQ